MQLRDIEHLVKLIENSSVEEIEISHWGTKVRISKKSAVAPVVTQMPSIQPVAAAPMIADQPPEEAGLAKSAEKKRKTLEITTPIIGTFYRAPSPDAAPYVEIGQVIEVGTPVCIIEAMKIMNEIESEVKGRIVEVCIENATPVQFGQALFILEPV